MNLRRKTKCKLVFSEKKKKKKKKNQDFAVHGMPSQNPQAPCYVANTDRWTDGKIMLLSHALMVYSHFVYPHFVYTHIPISSEGSFTPMQPTQDHNDSINLY